MDEVKIELGYGLLSLINDLEGRRLTDQIKALRKTLAAEYGFSRTFDRIGRAEPGLGGGRGLRGVDGEGGG